MAVAVAVRVKAVLLVLLAAACALPAALAQEAAAPNAAAVAAAAPGADADTGGKRLSDVLTRAYLSNAQLSAWMDEYVAKCGAIARKFSIGQSGSGTEIYALEISDKPGASEPEPNFKYTANMHGDETSGRMLLPMLAEWLCANNGKDDRATRLVKDAHLYLIPTMNPDGFARSWRGNKNGVDLNRNFPDRVKNAGWDLRRPLATTEPEVKAIMNFTLGIKNWAGAANFHEGAMVVNYPFDAYSDWRQQDGPSTSPDDATFKYLAKVYSGSHAFMSHSQEFKDGITNGANWYPISGGMQDWDYTVAGCPEVTIEVSMDKYRPASDLATIWGENKDALLAFALRMALGGARGRVTAAGTGAPLAATLYVKSAAGAGKPVPFYSGPEFGSWARPLAPGKYTIVASAPGYADDQADVTVPADGSGVVHDFVLKKAPGGAAAAAPKERRSAKN